MDICGIRNCLKGIQVSNMKHIIIRIVPHNFHLINKDGQVAVIPVEVYQVIHLPDSRIRLGNLVIPVNNMDFQINPLFLDILPNLIIQVFLDSTGNTVVKINKVHQHHHRRARHRTIPTHNYVQSTRAA